MRRLGGRPNDGTSNRRDIRGESGAVLVFVALSMVVLLGAVSLSIDVGRIYSERRELQNGADAAALAVAYDCAAGDCGSDKDQRDTAEWYADANASDASEVLDRVDEDDVIVDLGAQTVWVHTATEDPDGEHIFDTTFARMVGFDGLTVGAEATVAWGAPKVVGTLPIIFSICEYEEFTKSGSLHPKSAYDDGLLPDGSSFPPSYSRWEEYTTFFFLNGPPPDPPPVGYERCYETGSGDPPPPASFDFPGGFGWLLAEEDCSATILEGDWVEAKTGVPVTNGCSASDMEDLIGTVQLIPYFDEIDRPFYHIAGYGALYITGFRFPGGSGGPSPDGTSLITPDDGEPCDPPLSCLEGYLIGDWVVDGTPGGTGEFGVVSVGFVK